MLNASRLMLDEFGRVHKRLDEHDELLDAINRRFDTIETRTGNETRHDHRAR